MSVFERSSLIPQGCGLIAHQSGWLLAPEGAAVHPGESVAVVADVHLGYEWSRASGGDCLPVHSLSETIAKLASLLGRVQVERLIVAGDLVESPVPCPRTQEDLGRLVVWLEQRGVDLVAVRGNHDPQRRPELPLSVVAAGWTIGHGHQAVRGRRRMIGHHHPVLRAGGVTAPCFLVGPTTIVLPAFALNAAGFNAGSGPLPDGLPGQDLRCVASAGGELLDFGPLPKLRKNLRRR